MRTEHSTLGRRSLFRKHAGSIAWGLGFIVIVACFVAWRDYQARQPVLAPHQNFLDRLAEASTNARSILQRYYVEHRRETVASEDFLYVCGIMYQEAKAEGAPAAVLSDPRAGVCSRMHN